MRTSQCCQIVESVAPGGRFIQIAAGPAGPFNTVHASPKKIQPIQLRVKKFRKIEALARLASTSTQSQTESVAGQCAISTTMAPRALSSTTACCNAASPSLPRFEFGSSSTTRNGSPYKARASAMRWRCPPDSASPPRRPWCRSPMEVAGSCRGRRRHGPRAARRRCRAPGIRPVTFAAIAADPLTWRWYLGKNGISGSYVAPLGGDRLEK